MTIQGRVCLIHLILSCRIARCYLQVLVQYILVHLIILRRTNGTIDIKITCPCLLLNLADGVNQFNLRMIQCPQTDDLRGMLT